MAVASRRARKREVEGREELMEVFRAFQDGGVERVKREAIVGRYAAQYLRWARRVWRSLKILDMPRLFSDNVTLEISGKLRKLPGQCA